MAATAPITNVGSRVDLRLRAGADFLTQLTFLNPDGSAVDLTGVQLAAQVRRLPLDPVPVATFTIAVQQPPTSGIATMTMPGNVSAALTFGNSYVDNVSRYAWDLTLTDATGLVSAPIFGSVCLAAGVTR